LQVSGEDPLPIVTTLLALGPRIYVDGLVVLEGHKTLGLIGGRHAIEYILYHWREWMKGIASDVMIKSFSALDSDRRLVDALDIFVKSEFAFVPITFDQKVVTTLSMRDALRVVIDSKLETPISEISSQAITTSTKSSIGSALETMLEQNVRSLIVDDGDEISVVNDRLVLEYLLSHNCRQATSEGLQELYGVEIGALVPEKVQNIDAEAPASLAADRLLNSHAPCLYMEGKAIVTPWDIVIKGLMH
jgi:CBS domain-containing protein